MCALILKDYYVLIKQMKLFLLFILVFSVIPHSSMPFFAIVYVAMLPYTSLAYDERSKWDQLAAMMPYSTTDIVMGKYVLGWLLVGGTTILTWAIRLVSAQFTHTTVNPVSLMLAACVATITMALTMPFMFRFGVEKGRLLYMMAFIVLAIGTGSLTTELLAAPSTQWLIRTLVLTLPVITIVVNAVSVFFSVKLYAYGQR